MPKSKASNGEGSVYQRRRDGKWIAEIVTGYTQEGKKQILRFAAVTKREALEWRNKKLTEKQEGTLAIPTKQTLGQFMAEWIDTTAAHEVGPSTLQLYRNMTGWYISKHLGCTHLADIKPQQIQAMYHSLRETGKSPRTVQLVHAVLRRALQQATEWNLLPRNPVTLVKPPRLEHKEVVALSPEQVVRFIEAAKQDRLHALFTLAVTTGLRRGELLGLRWQDVNLDDGQLTVSQTQKKVGEKLTFGTTKTAKSRRTIDLPLVAVQSLKKWRLEQTQERFILGAAWQHPELVFTTGIGTPVHPKNMVDRNYRTILERAGLPKIKFHALRHSAATLMLAQGVNARVLQEVLGHSQIQITLGTYAHVLQSQKKEAATKVDDFLAASKRRAR